MSLCGRRSHKIDLYRVRGSIMLKNVEFQAVPKAAQKRHLGAQGAQKVPKRKHFGGLFGTFSGSGAKSENGVLAGVPALFRGFQGTPKS